MVDNKQRHVRLCTYVRTYVWTKSLHGWVDLTCTNDMTRVTIWLTICDDQMRRFARKRQGKDERNTRRRVFHFFEHTFVQLLTQECDVPIMDVLPHRPRIFDQSQIRGTNVDVPNVKCGHPHTSLLFSTTAVLLASCGPQHARHSRISLPPL